MRNFSYFIQFILLLSCAGGTSTGNPIRITVQSASYTEPLVGQRAVLRNLSEKMTDLDFKMCVTDISFENSEEERIELAFDDIGLVDLSDPSVTTTWGQIRVPEGEEFEFDTIVVFVQEDEELCGEDYSMRFKGEEIGAEFEIFFEYDPDDFRTDDGDFYRLDIEKIVEAADEALVDGEFNDSEWADYIDDFIGSFEEDDDIDDDEDEFGD